LPECPETIDLFNPKAPNSIPVAPVKPNKKAKRRALVSDAEMHARVDRLIGLPLPASFGAKLRGCTCPDATSVALGCPIHPLTYELPGSTP
jgi:hypothetical protein